MYHQYRTHGTNKLTLFLALAVASIPITRMCPLQQTIEKKVAKPDYQNRFFTLLCYTKTI